MTTTVNPSLRRQPLHMGDRARIGLAWGISIYIFFTVGWLAMSPDDPRGALSMWARDDALMVIASAFALIAISASVGTFLIGRSLPDAGVFGAALGLAVVTARGNHVNALFITGLHNGEIAGWGPRFIVESLLWAAAFAVGFFVSAWTYRWCYGSNERAEGRSDSALKFMVAGGWNRSLFAHWQPARVLESLKVFGVVCAIGLLGIRFFGAGPNQQALTHGQSYFAIGASIFIGTLLARRWFPQGGFASAWYAAVAVAVIGYAAGSFVEAGDDSNPAVMPASVYFRALPAAYLAMGTMGVLFASWYGRRLPANAGPAPQS